MDIRLQFNTESVNWQEAAEVIRLAPLAIREPEQLHRSFANSYVACFAFDSNRLVGMGRAICDGEFHAALYDLVVLPEYQASGIGKAIVEAIHDRLPKSLSTIILYANPGKEPFYEKLGYHRLLTGMIRPGDVKKYREKGHIK
jgi:GNAT superfamily N-acetyltransferase